MLLWCWLRHWLPPWNSIAIRHDCGVVLVGRRSRLRWERFKSWFGGGCDNDVPRCGLCPLRRSAAPRTASRSQLSCHERSFNRTVGRRYCRRPRQRQRRCSSRLDVLDKQASVRYLRRASRLLSGIGLRTPSANIVLARRRTKPHWEGLRGHTIRIGVDQHDFRRA